MQALPSYHRYALPHLQPSIANIRECLLPSSIFTAGPNFAGLNPELAVFILLIASNAPADDIILYKANLGGCVFFSINCIMVKRHHKQSDGMFHIDGHKFEELVGSRAKVWHGTAYKTSGNLKKKDLEMNKHGRIVSKRRAATAKKEKRLEKAGYKPTKGKFMPMHKSMRAKAKSSPVRKTRKSSKRRMARSH